MSASGRAAHPAGPRARRAPRPHAPRAAHAGERDPRLQRDAARGRRRRTGPVRADLQKIQAAGRNAARPHQRDPRPRAPRGAGRRDLEAAGARIRHDLRTPVNAIIGYCEMLHRGRGGRRAAALAADLRAHPRRRASKLLALIDDIVRLSGAGRRGRGRRATPGVAAMIEQAVSSIRPRRRARARGRRGRPHPGGGRQRDQPRHALAAAWSARGYTARCAENGRAGPGAAARGGLRPRAARHPDAGDERLPGAGAP